MFGIHLGLEDLSGVPFGQVTAVDPTCFAFPQLQRFAVHLYRMLEGGWR